MQSQADAEALGVEVKLMQGKSSYEFSLQRCKERKGFFLLRPGEQRNPLHPFCAFAVNINY
jgi:hypothetical protein